MIKTKNEIDFVKKEFTMFTDKPFLKSRKFIVFIVSIIIYFINSTLKKFNLPSIPSDHIPELILLIIGWLGAQGIADYNSSKNQEEEPEKVKESLPKD